jgi:hypothetical protein
LKSILVKVEVYVRQFIRTVVEVFQGFVTSDLIQRIVDYRIDGIVHILLPVGSIRFSVFPVVFVVKNLSLQKKRQ